MSITPVSRKTFRSGNGSQAGRPVDFVFDLPPGVVCRLVVNTGPVKAAFDLTGRPGDSITLTVPPGARDEQGLPLTAKRRL